MGCKTCARSSDYPEDYPEDAKLTSEPQAPKTWPEQGDMAEGFTYFFDIAPGRKPDVKFYLPIQKFGADDLTIARRLIDWMKARGRGGYGDRYLEVIHALAEHRDLGTGKGLHSYISYQFSANGVPDIKSYLVPEAFHPGRFPKAE
jgi:DMATS type aromatic prenyltransferase